MPKYRIRVRTAHQGLPIMAQEIGSMKASLEEATAARFVVLLQNEAGRYYSITSREEDEYITWERIAYLSGKPLQSVFLHYPQMPEYHSHYINGVIGGLSEASFSNNPLRPQRLCLFAAHVSRGSYILEEKHRVELNPSGSHLDWGKTFSEPAALEYSIARPSCPSTLTLPDGQHVAYDLSYSPSLTDPGWEVQGETACGIPASTLLRLGAQFRPGAATLNTLNCPHCLATLQNYQQLHPEQNLAGLGEYPTTVRAEPVVVSHELGLTGVLDWCFNCRAVTPQLETLSDPQRGLYQQCGECWAERPLGSKTRYEGWRLEE